LYRSERVEEEVAEELEGERGLFSKGEVLNTNNEGEVSRVGTYDDDVDDDDDDDDDDDEDDDDVDVDGDGSMILKMLVDIIRTPVRAGFVSPVFTTSRRSASRLRASFT
jgi:DNA-directed RNA polymerase specialized sigma subunit